MIFESLTIPPLQALEAAAGRTITGAGWREAVPFVYGQARIGGLILNVLPAGVGASNFLVQVLWCEACDSVSAIKLNGQDLPAGSSVTHYTGSQSSPDSALVAAFAAQSITYTDTLNGYAYSVLSIPTREFDGQLEVSALVKGRKIYDPRDGSQTLGNPSTWKWSDNPALALADFLTNATYGCATSVDWSSVSTAANACDQLVGSLNEKRRTLHVAFTAPVAATDVAETLRAYAGCWLVPSSSGVKLIPDVDGSSVATYAHESGNLAGIAALQYRDTGSSPTVVEVTYSDTSTVPWRQASRTAMLPGAGTTLPIRMSTVPMPGITRSTQAYREALERLRKLTTTQITTTIEVFDEGIKHEVGDIITVSHPIGLASRTFRIAAPPELIERGRWRLPLVEHSSTVYDTSTITGGEGPVEPVDIVPGPPDDVTGFTSGVEDGRVTLRWNDVTVADRRDFEIRVGASWAAGALVARTTDRMLRLAPLAAGAYTYWIKARDLYGNYSTNAPSAQATVSAPTAVTGLRTEVVDNNVLLYWNACTATQSLDGYEVRKGSTWASATVVGSNASSTFTALFEQVSGTYTYWVAAVDVAGNYGPPASTTATVYQPPDYVLRNDYWSNFAGTKTNTVLAAGVLYGPFSSTETWSQHFSTRSWNSPQDQINAGFPVYLTPSTTSGTYVETVQVATSTIPAATVTVEPTTQTVRGSPSLSCQIEVSDNGSSWSTPVTGFSVLCNTFKYIRVTLTISAPSAGDHLLAISALRFKTAIKLRTDSGAGTAAVGGTTVYFNYPFVAADTPIVQPNGSTPLIPVVIYSGGQNPTSFTVRLYNTSGTDVGGSFSWTVRGY